MNITEANIEKRAKEILAHERPGELWLPLATKIKPGEDVQVSVGEKVRNYYRERALQELEAEDR